MPKHTVYIKMPSCLSKGSQLCAHGDFLDVIRHPSTTNPHKTKSWCHDTSSIQDIPGVMPSAW